MPTVLRVVRETVAWGGLERQSDGSYRLGRRFWVLGAGSPCLGRIRRTALPHLHKLRSMTGHDVQLALLDWTSALLIEHAGEDHLTRALSAPRAICARPHGYRIRHEDEKNASAISMRILPNRS
jgi:DNA-binding IclR family transcriptional regulator